MPGLGIGFALLGDLQDPAENSDQVFFASRFWSWSVLSFSFAAAWVFSDPSRSISISLSRQLDRLCWRRLRSNVCRLPDRLMLKSSLTSIAAASAANCRSWCGQCLSVPGWG